MTFKKISVAIVLCAFCLIYACNDNKKEAVVNEVYQANTSESCNCEANWFPHASTPAPMEGIGSPFDTSSTTNCIFHQWSWQKFLWLTRPMAGGNAFFQDSLEQVDALLNPVAPYDNISLVLEDTAQAGSGAFLYTNPSYGGDNSSYLVYYSIFVNHTLLEASQAFKTAIQKDTSLLSNLEMFPDGSLELKISWVDVNAIPTALRSAYYTTTAVVKRGNVYATTTVALLGMHVVGKVINHPEFIWATFEHEKMAPYYDWMATTDSLDSPITSSDDKLLFARGSTTTLGGITSKNALAVIPYKVYSLYKYGVPRSPRDSFMVGTSQTEPVNYDNIDGLNNCVEANLDKTDVWINYFYNGSIWVNTDGLSPIEQANLIVSQGGNLGHAQAGAVARGSLNVFNLSMETFVQTGATNGPNTIHNIDLGDITNCLSCHTGAPFNLSFNGVKYNNLTSPLYVSHIFRNYMGATEETTIHDAKRQGIVDFMQSRAAKK